MCLSPLDVPRLHPLFPVRSLQICHLCHQEVSRCGGRKRTPLDDTARIAETDRKRTLLLVALVEEIVQGLAPSVRKKGGVSEAFDLLRARGVEEVLKGIQQLGVPYDMLAVIRALLVEIELTFESGRVKWSSKVVELPCGEDACNLVMQAIPRSMDDVKSGSTAGERAWNTVFGDVEPVSAPLPSCRIFEKALGLLDIQLTHVDSCEGISLRGGAPCKVRLHIDGLNRAMHRAHDIPTAPALKRLFSAAASPARRARKVDRPFALDRSSAMCCVCTARHDADTFPLKFTPCQTCPRQFCSMCLCNVLGSTEYMRSLEDAAYVCLLCRFRNPRMGLPPNGKARALPPARRKHGAVRKSKKGAQGSRELKLGLPLLLLSSNIRQRLFRDGGNRRPFADVRFAKLCETLNEDGLAESRGLSAAPLEQICLGCKTGGGAQSEMVNGRKRRRLDAEPLLQCGEKSCAVVMHEDCLRSTKGLKRKRGSGINCPRHKCSVCKSRGEGQLVRCRTCPAAFCPVHMPLPCNVHIFSSRLIACADCRELLYVPQRSVGRMRMLPGRRMDGPGATLEKSLLIHDGQKVADVEMIVQIREEEDARIAKMENVKVEIMEEDEEVEVKVVKHDEGMR